VPELVRVYLPVTLPLLTALRTDGEIRLAVARGHAVTPDLREWYVDGDEEELEYVAFTRAAQDSLQLLHDDVTAPPRRAVIAVDASPQVAVPLERQLGSSAVRAPERVGLAEIVAIHVDSTAAEPNIRAAAQAATAAAAGDEDAQFTVDGAEDHELEWYDVTELDQIVA
jgi:hypothetical protein